MTAGDNHSHNMKFKAPQILAVIVAVLVVVLVGTYVSAKTSGPRLYLSPATTTVASGDTLKISVRENSHANLVNAVQANLSYNPAQLQFMNISGKGSAFVIEAQASGGNGRVLIAQAVQGGSAPVSGDQQVATVTFKVLSGTGSGDVSFTAGSAVVRSQGNTALPVRLIPTAVHFKTGVSMPAMQPTPSTSPSPTSSAAPGGPATIYLDPASGSVASGANLTFEIHENSGSTPVNVVQADYSYSTSQYQFVSISGSSSAFGLQAQSSGDNGHIVIVRGITPGSTPLSGAQDVATVTLKAIGSGTAAVTAAGGSALVRSSGNTNILTQITGSSFQIE
jgi:hypothetical protein